MTASDLRARLFSHLAERRPHGVLLLRVERRAPLVALSARDVEEVEQGAAAASARPRRRGRGEAARIWGARRETCGGTCAICSCALFTWAERAAA